MAKRINIEPNKTYATEENAVRAVEKKYGGEVDGLTYFIMPTKDGRFFPVFTGLSAVDAGVFFHFNVVA